MTKTLARLARMSPDEIRTRTRQAFDKRWQTPPACRLVASSASPAFLDPPAACPPGLLDQADKICRHRFDLLGYQDLDFGSPIDWHFDPVHRKRAPRKPFYKIPFLDFDQVGDHKVIWELNRHQHLVTLAEAWWFTKDARFTAELLAQWRDWQKENPYPIGINWASTLEVAFRALSWLWIRRFLGDFDDQLLPALHLHGWYIEHFLSTYFAPNTHLLGEGVALFSIGLLCPQFPASRRWQQRGWEIVLRQAETQVLADGFHFEQSVYYHVYALDFFLFARALAARNAVPIPAAFDRTIDSMREALSAISQAGLPPTFGDDDGGHVIGAPRSPLPPTAGSVALTSAGIYAMTSARSQLFIDAGKHGAFSGGHGHADALSVQLVTSGRRVLIDPGTFCYVCPERDRFRGTAAHNTLQVDGRDQATPVNPFAWTGMPQTTVDRWVAGDTYDLFAGHHDGYHPVIHHRWVFGLKNRFWLIRDIVTDPLPLTDPHLTDPHLTDPHLTDPHLTDPHLTDPHLTDPHLTDPHLTDPHLTDPHLTDPRLTDPRLTDPHLTDPRLTDPHLTDPRLTDPHLTDPHLTDPHLTDPHLTDPHLTEPRPSGSRSQSGSGSHRLAIHWHFLDERDLAILPPAGHHWSQSVEPFDWSPVYGKKAPASVRRFSIETSLPAEFAVILLPPGAAGVFTCTKPGVYRYEEKEQTHDFIFDGAQFTYRGFQELSL